MLVSLVSKLSVGLTMVMTVSVSLLCSECVVAIIIHNVLCEPAFFNAHISIHCSHHDSVSKPSFVSDR